MEYKIKSLGGIKKEISYHTNLEEIKEYLSEELCTFLQIFL